MSRKTKNIVPVSSVDVAKKMLIYYGTNRHTMNMTEKINHLSDFLTYILAANFFNSYKLATVTLKKLDEYESKPQWVEKHSKLLQDCRTKATRVISEVDDLAHFFQP